MSSVALGPSIQETEWMEDVRDVVEAIKKLGKGATISIYSRPKPGPYMAVDEVLLSVGTYVSDSKQRAIWVAWNDDQEPNSEHKTLTEFPFEGNQYARPQLRRIPVRRTAQDEEVPSPKRQRTERPQQAAPPTVFQEQQAPPQTRNPRGEPSASQDASSRRRGSVANDELREDEMARFMRFWELMKQAEKRARESSSSDDDDETIRDIASGDKGVWVRVVANLKIPQHVPHEYLWMYLYAHEAVPCKGKRPKNLESLSASAWREHAVAFQLKYSSGFKNVALAEETDNIVTILSEVMEHRKTRTTKREWCAVFFFVARFIFLILMSSNMGGLASAQNFAAQFDSSINTKEAKLDIADIFNETLRKKTETAPAAKPADPPVTTAHLNEKIDTAVKTLLSASATKQDNQQQRRKKY